MSKVRRLQKPFGCVTTSGSFVTIYIEGLSSYIRSLSLWRKLEKFSEQSPVMLSTVYSSKGTIILWLHQSVVFWSDLKASQWDVTQKRTRNKQKKNSNSIKKRSRYIPQRVKIEVLIRDNARCIYCGESDPAKLEFDHLEAWRKGGDSDDSLNVGVSCFKCNRSKGDRDWGWG